MRLKFPLFLAGFLLPAAGEASPQITIPSGIPEGYGMVFEDDFQAPTLDVSKWNTTMAFDGRKGGRYHNISYLHYLQDDDVILCDGILQLRASHRAVEGNDPAGRFEYSAGLITTHDKHYFKYGYFEIRAKYPGGRGVWPCIWLISQEQYWPPEFDIAEYVGGIGEMRYGLCHGTLKNVQWDSTVECAPLFEAGWHTYALDWRAGQAIWYVDGKVKKVVTAEYVPDTPMYLILSNGVSSRIGPAGEPAEKTVFPNFFEIDYVRVYQPPGASERKKFNSPILAITAEIAKP